MQIQEIKLTNIQPVESGERAKDVRSLAESIKAVGLIQPIIVAPIPDGFDKKGAQLYTIIAGHRRYAAVKSLKEDTIRSIVTEATEDKAQAMRITENVHRLPLTPLQEAEAIAKLRALGRSTEEIAADLAMGKSSVVRREQLNNLTPDWLKYISEIGEGKSMSVAAFEMISRYDADTQGKLFKQQMNRGHIHVPTVEWLKDELARFDKHLKAAPFDVADVTLNPKAGACTSCPKRSGCQPLLFIEDSDTKKIASEDRCLDITCWSKKLQAYGKRRIEELKAKHPDLVLVKRDEYNASKVVAGLSRLAETFRHGGWNREVEACKKEDKGARPAMIINEKGLGHLEYVKVKPRDDGSPARPKKSVEKNLTPEQKAAKEADELRQRREAWIANKIEDLVGFDSKAPVNIVKMKSEDTILLLGCILKASDVTDASLVKNWKRFSRQEALDRLWRIVNQDIYLKNSGELRLFAERILGLNWAELEAEALKAVPDPKPKAGAAQVKSSKKAKRGKK